ncbi:hypothetical protein [Vibrio sp. WXL210]|uniref:hypothetical protein n=1 Tax=Vibrio sp. WXL210 TaxID=3450709 RepID=UPI003EC8FE36
MKIYKKNIVLLASAILFTTGVAADSAATNKVSELTSEIFLSNAKANNYAKTEMVGKQLKIEFDAVSEMQKYSRWPLARFTPQKGWWNWADKQSIKFNVTNPTSESAQVYFKLIDSVGLTGQKTNQLNYGVRVKPGETKEVEMLLDGGKRKLRGYEGGTQINLQGLIELSVFVRGPIDQQTVLLENFQVVSPSDS